MTAVDRTVVFTDAASGSPVPAGLHCDARTPFEVWLAFDNPLGPPVEWVFARGLLVDGLVGIAGVGDVCCWPDGDRFYLGLSSPDGRAVFHCDAADVRAFVAETARFGDAFDVDTALAALLDGAA